jgi:hypothetical protein
MGSSHSGSAAHDAGLSRARVPPATRAVVPRPARARRPRGARAGTVATRASSCSARRAQAQAQARRAAPTSTAWPRGDPRSGSSVRRARAHAPAAARCSARSDLSGSRTPVGRLRRAARDYRSCGTRRRSHARARARRRRAGSPSLLRLRPRVYMEPASLRRKSLCESEPSGEVPTAAPPPCALSRDEDRPYGSSAVRDAERSHGSSSARDAGRQLSLRARDVGQREKAHDGRRRR